MATLINKLYLGAASEHYVMGECYRSNMEAFKLPIDKGFDLAVTNAFSHFTAAETNTKRTGSDLPIYLQVKSSSAKSVAEPDESSRPKWSGKFILKKYELDLIRETPNSALACVSFIRSSSNLSLARTVFSWWVSSREIRELLSTGHFINADSVTFTLNYMIVEKNHKSPCDQNTYVQFMRQRKAEGINQVDLVNGKIVPKECFYFDKLREQLFTESLMPLERSL